MNFQYHAHGSIASVCGLVGYYERPSQDCMLQVYGPNSGKVDYTQLNYCLQPLNNSRFAVALQYHQTWQ